MPNPIYNSLNASQQPNMMQQFQAFMQQMRGQDPNALLNASLCGFAQLNLDHDSPRP